jgi:amino acid transporter
MSNLDQPAAGAQPTGDQPVSGTSTIVDPAVATDPVHHHHSHAHEGGTVHENAPYAYSLISWGSVIAGALIALAIGGMLSLAGLAVGATALNPGDSGSAASVGIGAGLWLALSTILGMLIGGYVAARSAHNPDHHEGALHGATVWAVGFVLAFFLTGSFASNAAFSGMQAASQAAEAVSPAAASRATDAARDAADAATPETPQQRERIENAADATGTGAFWAFLTMLTSGLAAILGGSLGAKHDERLHRLRRAH